MGNAQEVEKTMWRSLRSTVITAGCLFSVDAVVFGWFALAMLASFFLVVWLVPRTLLAFIRGEVFAVRGMKTGIYLLTVAAILAAYSANSHLARSGANTVIAAVDQFKSHHHRYPKLLKELVPEYLKSVPRAKYTVTYGEFVFSGGGPSLMYYQFPPFLRRVYNFDSRKWMVLD